MNYKGHEIPEPPPGSEHWHQTSFDKWEEVIKFLIDEGRWVPVSATTIATYCYDVTLCEIAAQSIADHGLLVTDERGTKKNPATTIFEQCRRRMKDFEVQFGFTPLSRHRMDIKQIKDAKSEQTRKRVPLRKPS